MLSSSDDELAKNEQKRYDRTDVLHSMKKPKKQGKSKRFLPSRIVTKSLQAFSSSSRFLASSLTNDLDSTRSSGSKSGILRGLFGTSIDSRLKPQRNKPNNVSFEITNIPNKYSYSDRGVRSDGRSGKGHQQYQSRRRFSVESASSTVSRRRSNVDATKLTIGIEEESAQYLDLVQNIRVRDWFGSFRRMDPRFQIMRFFDDVAQEGSHMLLRSSGFLNPSMVSPILKAFRRSSVFSVWRPTSKDSIKKMILGHGTGKGLDIKGKSAKLGKLSAFVPFLQIHDEDHKRKVNTIQKNDTIRIFYKKKAARDNAKEILEHVAKEMADAVAEAKRYLNDDSVSDDELEEKALKTLLWDVDCKVISTIDDYGPTCYGLVVAKRVFWEAYVMKQDISRTPGSTFDTGRPSIPSFQDMNLASIKQYDENNPCPTDKPRAVVWQFTDPYNSPNDPDPDPMLPQTLLMAYEENGRVLPVVSDFDCFLVGTRAVQFKNPIPKDQVELVNWTINETEKILQMPVSEKGWTSKWLEIMKDTRAKAHHVKMPTYGFGDPMSYSIMKHAVGRLGNTGAVRHGAECFNYYFPQELDDEFLVVSESFLDDEESKKFGRVPWRYLDEIELQQFLDNQIDKGFTFPLNPKWVLCDKGWKKIYDKLLACQKPNVQQSLNAWLPPESGIRERIEEISAKYPDGFQVLEAQVRDSKKKSKGTQSMDLAELEIQRYLTLQRAKRKLRAIMFWISLGQKAKKKREAMELLQQQIGESEESTNHEIKLLENGESEESTNHEIKVLENGESEESTKDEIKVLENGENKTQSMEHMESKKLIINENNDDSNFE